MILKDIEVFRIAKLKSQRQRPVAIGLNRDCLPYIPLIHRFIEMPTEAWSTFAESRARHELIESSELDSVPELIAGVPIISDLQTPASRPASAGLAHKPSLLPHGIGTVTRSPIRRVLYGLFKPLLMIARDVSRIRMSMVLSNLTRAPLVYLSSDIESVQYSILCLNTSIFAELVDTSIGKHG